LNPLSRRGMDDEDGNFDEDDYDNNSKIFV
jgi:hypothetical protein